MLGSSELLCNGRVQKVEEECRVTMLHDDIDLSKLMVHAQQVEENRLGKTNREAKEEKYF